MLKLKMFRACGEEKKQRYYIQDQEPDSQGYLLSWCEEWELGLNRLSETCSDVEAIACL